MLVLNNQGCFKKHHVLNIQFPMFMTFMEATSACHKSLFCIPF